MAKFGKKSNSKFGNKSRSSSRGGYSKRSKGGGDFTRVGSIVASKSTAESKEFDAEELIEALMEVEAKFWVNFYLPKGVKEMTVTNDTRMLISFSDSDKTPDFVLGSASIAEEE